MSAAFLTPAGLSGSLFTSYPPPSTCSPQQPTPSYTALTMSCRRDLKKEKALRNLEYARRHRKKTPNRYQKYQKRSNANDQGSIDQQSDEQFLSSMFGTIKFGADARKDEEEDARGRDGGKDSARSGSKSGARTGAGRRDSTR